MSIKINKFKNGIRSPEEAYWFGFLVGDGCVYENRYRLKLSLQVKDRFHLEKFTNFLGCSKDRIYDYGSMSELRIDNKELLNSLYKLGLCQNKVKKTHKGLIPNKFKKDFIRGLFDADGTLHLRSNKNYLTAQLRIYGTKNLLEGIRDVLKTKINRIDEVRYIKKSKGCYVLSFGGRWLVGKIGNYLFKNAKIYLERKYNLFLILFKYNKKFNRKWKRFDRIDINNIKKLNKKGIIQKEIAKRFGTDQSHISRIINNKRYKIIGGD